MSFRGRSALVNGNTSLAYARVWRHVDGENQVLGRVASDIAKILMGKHKPVYHPSIDSGDYVVVTNARHLAVTGRKVTDKLYRSHSTYPGGLKERTFEQMHSHKPEDVLRLAVKGMMRRGPERKRQLERLFIFPDASHPYESNIHQNHERAAFIKWAERNNGDA